MARQASGGALIAASAGDGDRAGTRRLLRPALLGVTAGLVVVMCGGYLGHWSWTGINGSTATVWDWLQLLLLPVAVGLLPLTFASEIRLTARHRAVIASGLAAFTALVVLGYAVPLRWTGFGEYRLWDWMHLMLLPTVIALAPVLATQHGPLSVRHRAMVAAVLAGFVVVTLGGYLWDWTWTGIHGNTLWDWLQLLFLPLVARVVLTPAVASRARSHLAAEGGGPEPRTAAATDTATAPATATLSAPPPTVAATAPESSEALAEGQLALEA